MNVLNNNDINILDLPDEILSIIFNKLKTIDIFYSLLGVCSKILPRINDKITKLTLDPFSTEHILSAVKYPQLHSLSLDNYQSHILLRHLKDGEIFCVNDQITDLTVNIYHAEGELSGELETIVFVAILFYCRYLTDLTFSEKFSSHYLSFASCDIPQEYSLPSTLS
ncbi:unnamed protein product [Rotaria magnacalcarata]|uniref:F-box domain-containing protein n=1 Tax=Rotaria magnacalcarata TaxID=392030 RepID=A0A819WIP1_9BILA|nr:unnamed protein product [Rotaria magnacalcarata]